MIELKILEKISSIMDGDSSFEDISGIPTSSPRRSNNLKKCGDCKRCMIIYVVLNTIFVFGASGLAGYLLYQQTYDSKDMESTKSFMTSIKEDQKSDVGDLERKIADLKASVKQLEELAKKENHRFVRTEKRIANLSALFEDLRGSIAQSVKDTAEDVKNVNETHREAVEDLKRIVFSHRDIHERENVNMNSRIAAFGRQRVLDNTQLERNLKNISDSIITLLNRSSNHGDILDLQQHDIANLSMKIAKERKRNVAWDEKLEHISNNVTDLNHEVEEILEDISAHTADIYDTKISLDSLKENFTTMLGKRILGLEMKQNNLTAALSEKINGLQQAQNKCCNQMNSKFWRIRQRFTSENANLSSRIEKFQRNCTNYFALNREELTDLRLMAEKNFDSISESKRAMMAQKQNLTTLLSVEIDDMKRQHSDGYNATNTRVRQLEEKLDKEGEDARLASKRLQKKLSKSTTSLKEIDIKMERLDLFIQNLRNLTKTNEDDIVEIFQELRGNSKTELERFEELNQGVKQLNSSVQNLRSLTKTREEDIVSMSLHIQEITMNVSALKGEVEDLQTRRDHDVSTMREKIEQLEDQLEQEATYANQSMDELKKKLSSYTKSLQKRSDDLQKRLDGDVRNIEKIWMQLGENEANVGELESRIMEMNLVFGNLSMESQATTRGLEKTNHNLKAINYTHNGVIQKLMKRDSMQNENLVELENNLTILQMRMETMEDFNATISADLNSLKKNIGDARSTYDEAIVELKRADSIHNGSLDKLKENVERLDESIDDVEKLAHQVQKELKTTVEELKTLNETINVQLQTTYSPAGGVEEPTPDHDNYESNEYGYDDEEGK